MDTSRQQGTVDPIDKKPDASRLPVCPRCRSEMAWGGRTTKASTLGCIMSLTKLAWLNLLFRPKCPSCGKISKFEIVSHRGGVPGVFWLWIISALVGAGLIVATIIGFLISAGKPR
jgi:hypothetical protein